METTPQPSGQPQQPSERMKVADAWRWQLGLSLASQVKIEKRGSHYLVPSQSGNGWYMVNPNGNPTCNCPDFQLRQRPCKHAYAVGFHIHVEADALKAAAPSASLLSVMPSPPVVRNWAAYNQSQVDEGRYFGRLLRSLCDNTPEPPKPARGRWPVPFGDILFCLVLQTYCGLPTRRVMSVLQEAYEKGLLSAVPSFPTIYKYTEDPRLVYWLRHMVERSALPLASVENRFAVDSSWFPAAPLKDGTKAGEKATPVKLHIMSGVKTGVVTTAAVIPGHSGDYPFFEPFVGITAKHFDVQEVSADRAYLGIDNLRAVDRIGGAAYIPFKSNSRRIPARGEPADLLLWERAYHFFSYNKERFLEHYHKRSTVETVFYTIKTRFGRRMRSRTSTAQVNETMAKVLCHNLCSLIRAAYELDVQPVFDA